MLTQALWIARLARYNGVRFAFGAWSEDRRWCRDERRRVALWGVSDV